MVVTRAIKFLRASNGAVATSMNEELVSEWTLGKLGCPISFQAKSPAGVVGTFSVEGTNDADPDYASVASSTPAEAYQNSPSQPSGVAGETSILATSTHAAMRMRYTPSEGGLGVVPTCRVASEPV